MSYITAFVSSINNIRTKLGRTILTAFAGSIGIIGIALILSLSNGMQTEIDRFERETLSSYPITISDVGIDINALMSFRGGQEDLEEHPDFDYVIPELSPFEQNAVINPLSDDYVEYIERYIRNDGQETLAGYRFNYRFNLNLLYENLDGQYEIIESENKTPDETDFFPFSANFLRMQPEGDVFDENYDMISETGRFPENTVDKMDNKQIEVLLVVNAYNQIPKEQLEYLGFDIDQIDDTDTIAFTDLIGRQVKLYVGDYVEGTSDINDAYTLTITGVVRTKPNTNVNLYMGGGLIYDAPVEAYFLDNHDDELGTSLFNRSGIQNIALYPADFESKEEILSYLDNYNRLYPNDQVIYNDQAALFTSISSGIINAISIVLIAFASISLVVSSIMIAIITYVSVLERTKEIGVLRALGARKKDISRVFNTENVIIGFSAGAVGILITLLLMIPLNIILENLSDISNIAKLSFLHIIALIAVSVFLAFLAGLVPARMAAKKDPVEALRTE